MKTCKKHGPLTWSKLFLTLAMNFIWRRLQTFCCTQTKDWQQLQWHCWIILLIPLAEEIFLRSAYKLLRKMSIGGWQKRPSSGFHGQQQGQHFLMSTWNLGADYLSLHDFIFVQSNIFSTQSSLSSEDLPFIAFSYNS